jgi:uncharacterized membrane protein YfcA
MKNNNLNKNKSIDVFGNDYYVKFPMRSKYNNNGIILKLIMGAVIGFVNGFWGGGGGMICVPILSQVLKLPEKSSHATTLLIMLPLCITSLIIYIIQGNLLLIDAIKIGIGFVIGGIIGAIILKHINNTWLGFIFSLIIIAGGIKLIL